MEQAQVIVSQRSPDQRTQGIANAVDARDDMALVGGAVLPVAEVLDWLARLPAGLPCAVICVGSRADGWAPPVDAWLARRGDVVVLDVDLDADSGGAAVRFERLERFALHDMRLDSMLHALHELMTRGGSGERVLHFKLHSVAGAAPPDAPRPAGGLAAGPVLKAGLQWLHTVLLAAIRARRAPLSTLAESDAEANGDWVGFGVNAATTEHAMAARGALQAVPLASDMLAAADELWQSLREGDGADADAEPLAAMAHRLALTQLELQLLLLVLSPDFDARYQGCMAVLLDDASRRVGTLGLHASLLGESVAVTRRLLASGGLVRWRLLHDACVLPNADDPLRADPHVRAWLLGDRDALEADPRLQRLLRTAAWPGADLFPAGAAFRAASLLADLCSSRGALCIVVASESPPYALALLEHGAHLRDVRPLRVDLARLCELDRAELAEAALRLGRAALLTDRPLLLDASADSVADEPFALAFAALGATGCRFGVVSADAQVVVRSLGALPFRLEAVRQGKAERTELFRCALASAGAKPDELGAQFLAANFPLQIDGIAAALRLAQAHAGADDAGPAERFTASCKAIAMQGISRLAEHIEPGFDLADIVLPRERAEQLHEIVASVRLAPMVLDQWDFQRHLPYGRGTSVLFHGPSGTGKTMAAHGIAKALNVHVLRLDLSRVVSKYLGETEKHCDQVFSDAAHSGAAVLIDEADALFGKRSEVKDSHDRYANIEVAFLLQRIETFEGLAILTTNLRQNIDPAFLRRLRFIVEFPRPDVQARAAIWKSCLPPASHCVSDEELGDLARRIDLTGGHIRQITLRAAFLAADRGERIELRHLLAAGRAELAKLGMPAVGLGVPTLAPARRAA